MSGMGLKWLPGVCWLYQTKSKWLFKTRTKVLAENRVSLLYILSVQKHWLMVWRQSSKACTVYGKTSINTVYMKIWNPGKTTFFTVNNVWQGYPYNIEWDSSCWWDKMFRPLLCRTKTHIHEWGKSMSKTTSFSTNCLLWQIINDRYQPTSMTSSAAGMGNVHGWHGSMSSGDPTIRNEQIGFMTATSIIWLARPFCTAQKQWTGDSKEH